MTKETFDRAKEILSEISDLKSEIHRLLDARQSVIYDDIRLKKVMGRSSAWMDSYSHRLSDELRFKLMDVIKKDAGRQISNIISKIRNLQKEFRQL